VNEIRPPKSSQRQRLTVRPTIFKRQPRWNFPAGFLFGMKQRKLTNGQKLSHDAKNGKRQIACDDAKRAEYPPLAPVLC